MIAPLSILDSRTAKWKHRVTYWISQGVQSTQVEKILPPTFPFITICYFSI
jgi:hypothetical protein